ncbi:hypothetical protein N8340_00315 [Flavobacteriaceae bacterium]|mgnify:CR=1 FL=1|nr:hypothetical protein [Flavobacteriaceae bacterium]MDB9903878.1 hypothetical protein [Flavobacteriaceae bacterium]MDC1393097.1 hypothetical protein [Flavobacteriaceae bacterium]|tara:strand:- start:256 stop:564 length:309 start_codon:yes stop_codon:yes gene_type:complete
MWYKQNIKIWVIGTLFLWLLSALMPAVSVYIFQEADQISMTGTLEEEQQQEKKEENKKEWIYYHILINPTTITAASLTHGSVVKKTYNSPANIVVLPPPELV